MYEQLKKRFTKLLGLLCKQDGIPDGKYFKKLDKKWLNDKQNLLDTYQMDIRAATQASLKDLQITSGKKQAFRTDCRVVVVNIILKLVEKTPVRYSFVRSSTCLDPKSIANNKKSASQFKALADGLSHIKKRQLKLPIWQNFNITNFKRLPGKNITLGVLLLIL